VCQWTDQCEFGFEFITLYDHSIVHLPQHRYIKGTTNLSTRPVFHPDERFWVCAYQDNTSWWVDENTHSYGTQPAKEGKREKLGALMVFRQTQPLIHKAVIIWLVQSLGLSLGSLYFFRVKSYPGS
jgi:hypothetical protein